MVNVKSFDHPLSYLKTLRQGTTVAGRSLLLAILSIGLPLLGFAELASVIWQGASFAWDEPILQLIHRMETPQLTHIAAHLTNLGGFKGGTVLGTLCSLVLLQQRRWRSLTYLLITLIGSGLINRMAKLFFHRPRPQLWESVISKVDFAFPSGHATTSMTLVAALIILFWGSRWFWLVVLSGSSFVLAIAWTRLYLGVHFPSDILAGWLVSLAWAMAISLIMRPHQAQLNTTG